MEKDKLINVKIKKGTFYISSKTNEGEGWTKQEFMLPNKDGVDEKMVRYHKEVSLEGTVQWMGLQDGFNNMEQYGMILKGEDGNSYALQIPVLSTGKVETINNYLSSISGVITQLRKGDKVTMFVNNKNKDKNGRLYRNIVVLDENNKLIKNDFSFKEVPSWVSTDTKNFKGEVITTWNADDANAFYYNKIKEAVETFGNSGESTKKEEPQQKETAKPENDVNSSLSDEYDNLPF